MSFTALETVFCNDEDIAIKAGGDFVLLTPQWQRLAYGTDGAFSAGSFTMTSATATFTGDLQDGNVIWLTKPVNYYHGGELLAVSSVPDDTSLVLRRVGIPDGVGVPPGGNSALTGVEYAVPTMMPQIEEATRELSRRLNIDPDVIGRTPQDIHDLHDLELATVLTVLINRMSSELQADAKSGWNVKLKNFKDEFDSVMSRLRLRWDTSTSGGVPETSSVTMRWSR